MSGGWNLLSTYIQKIKNSIQRTLVFPSPTYSKAVSSDPAGGGWDALEEPAASSGAGARSSLLTGAYRVSPGCHVFQQGGGVAKGSSAVMLVLGGETCPSIWGQLSPALPAAPLVCSVAPVGLGLGKGPTSKEPPQDRCFEELGLWAAQWHPIVSCWILYYRWVTYPCELGFGI